mgnify:CR=1 FL=1
MTDRKENMSRNYSANAMEYAERNYPQRGERRGERSGRREMRGERSGRREPSGRSRGEDRMDTAINSGHQRVKRGSRNRGYDGEEADELQYRGMYMFHDYSEEEHRRRFEHQREEYQEQYGERSRMYETDNYEEINVEPDYDDDPSQETKNTRHGETRYPNDQRIKRNGRPEPGYPDDAPLDTDHDNTGYNETRFVETRIAETIFSNDQKIEGNGSPEPQNMVIGINDRGYPPPHSHAYPAPVPMMIDRRADVTTLDLQYNQGGIAWNTQVPFVVQNYPPVPLPKTEEEEKKPRKIWWYTTSRVFSAILIICNLVSDWLQESDMDDPISDFKDSTKVKVKECPAGAEDAAKQYLYFTIAGTVLAAGQLVNIIYQIVQNHRLPAEDKIPEYVDERTEVFLVNAFVEFPQNFLICRWEKNVPTTCVECGISLNSKKMKRFMNGFVSLASSFWRFLTHVNVSSDGSKCSCAGMFAKCGERLGKCIKSCCMGCLKFLCPCCSCCLG